MAALKQERELGKVPFLVYWAKPNQRGLPNPMNKTITVALAGNPNAGKTTIFNALTGARQHVGNWPGVTVEKKEGRVTGKGADIHIIDLPGTYSLTAFSLEEQIARSFIVDERPNAVIDVVDASNLERNLYLTVQLMEMDVQVIMALNMIDVARGRNISIDHEKLSELLGISITPTDGKRGIGVKDLVKEIVNVHTTLPQDRPQRFLNYGAEVEEELEIIIDELEDANFKLDPLPIRWVAVKLLESDPEIIKLVHENPKGDEILELVSESRNHLEGIFGDPPEIALADARYGFISGAIKQCVTVKYSDRIHLSEQIDKVLTHKLLGPMILLIILYGVYKFTFQVSGPLVEYFESAFVYLGDRVSDILPDGLIQSMVVSGVIDGVGGVLGFTPLIAFMFLAIAILEDTGYMARIAFMLDRVLRGFGLHGASMLALMVSGGIAGGCAVPGIMATRTMKEPKERLATILVAPLMNCGAKLPVYALLIAAFFPGNKAGMMFLLTLISWSMALLAGKVIRSTVLSGPSAPFVLELPPYRIPTLKALVIHTWERTWMYVKKAGTVILAVSIILWAMMTFPILPDSKAQVYMEKKNTLAEEFLAEPIVKKTLESASTPKALKGLKGAISNNKEGFGYSDLERYESVIDSMAQGSSPYETNGQADATEHINKDFIKKYRDFAEKVQATENNQRTAQLKYTLGGRLGVFLEGVFHPIGFEWKTCIALVGGFAAKEVVVSTMGTAYSLGDVDPESTAGLSDRLKKAPGWNPLTAFSLIMFVMLYAPCFVTLVVINKETGSWKWTLFAVVYTTTLAYIVALAVKLVGQFLGLGVS